MPKKIRWCTKKEREIEVVKTKMRGDLLKWGAVSNYLMYARIRA